MSAPRTPTTGAPPEGGLQGVAQAVPFLHVDGDPGPGEAPQRLLLAGVAADDARDEAGPGDHLQDVKQEPPRQACGPLRGQGRAEAGLAVAGSRGLGHDVDHAWGGPRARHAGPSLRPAYRPAYRGCPATLWGEAGDQEA